MTSQPRSTYRLQITPTFTLADAAGVVDYVARLGADWIYTSPLLASEPGSDHGYDVIDHSRTDPQRGGEAGLADLADRAHALGMGVLVDIVPNHVGVASPLLSVWWRDLLTFGDTSRYAAAFDVDWAAGGGKMILPVLGDGDDDLAALRLEQAHDGSEVLRYYEHEFPVAPGTSAPGAAPVDVHARQHYRLVNFRCADTDLNYRRFFAVSSLAAIRVEDAAVFAESHAEIRRWLDLGWVDGLRVDHPDGLADPAGYLRSLAELTGGRYTVVEKILEPGEQLPGDWHCHGTTGYETLADIDRVLTDADGALTMAGAPGNPAQLRSTWTELVRGTKRLGADTILGSEVRRLARLLPGMQATEFSDAAWQRRVDAIAEVLASFEVYRTYRPSTDAALRHALSAARGSRPELSAELDLISTAARDDGNEFAIRLQQTSGSVMAKGVEDCAFFRYRGLASLAEVGGDPSLVAVTASGFHRSQERRMQSWPHGMTTLSTHDTKRGEDVRARIAVLSEIADEWMAAVAHWCTVLGVSNPAEVHPLLQTAVGAWPIERDRLHRYAEKSAREAGTSTSWTDPDEDFERDLHRWVDSCYPGGAIHDSLAAVADRIIAPGWSNSLAAKLIQLTAPGVPDVYRGTELWRNDVVDPDNRRPFDPLAPGGAAELLARLDGGWLPAVDADGAVKLLVTSRALRARRDRPELFTGYRGLQATGGAASHALAFDRGGAVTVATRLPVGLARRGGWADTRLELPGNRYRDVLTGRGFAVNGGEALALPLGDLLAQYPVALLLSE